ncbi:MAG: SAM-dependent methyltransferase, partial [Phycisphaerae bacterium]
VYHHFEYPMSTLATLHSAMRSGGELVVVDFIRIPGTSSEWVLGHVRAGQDVFIKEIQAAGFELLDRGENIDYLTENYLMRFRKVD